MAQLNVLCSVQMLSPTQVAKCIVQAYPYTPDTLAMCSWIAAEDGDQSERAARHCACHCCRSHDLTLTFKRLPGVAASWGLLS